MKKISILYVAAAAIGIMSSCTKQANLTEAPDLTNANTTTSLPSAPGDVVGKVIVGYQGWFSCAGDGSPIGGWSHYSSNSSAPGSTNTVIKSWPDVTGQTTTYSTAWGNLGNGQPAKLYSPWDQQSVNVQFQSMQAAGIDGVALQRFGSWIVGGNQKAQVDGIATRVKNAAQTYGRKFYIMYDCNSNTNAEADWTNTIIGTLNLLASPAYAKQNGKPVVCFWGVGKDGRGTTAEWVAKINWFKAQGCYVIGGALANWRTDTPDLPAYNACNMIMPWMIGVIGSVANSDNNYTTRMVPDISYCNTHGIDYQMCVNPGDLALGQRHHGDLMWRNFYNAKLGGAQGIYIAMFDEYNEGNQIAKTAESAAFKPVGFPGATLDEDGTAVSSDYYMRLTGDGGKMLKGQIALTATRPTPYYVGGGGSGVTFYANTNYGGAASQVLPVGTYTLAQLIARSMPNDWASSVKVPAGRTLIMYSNDNFGGTSWTRTSDTPNFTTLSPSANDAVSSVKVQ